jgi:hypothetical protein
MNQKNFFYEIPTISDSNNSGDRLVAWRFCLERRQHNTRITCDSDHIVAARLYQARQCRLGKSIVLLCFKGKKVIAKSNGFFVTSCLPSLLKMAVSVVRY